MMKRMSRNLQVHLVATDSSLADMVDLAALVAILSKGAIHSKVAMDNSLPQDSTEHQEANRVIRRKDRAIRPNKVVAIHPSKVGVIRLSRVVGLDRTRGTKPVDGGPLWHF